MAADVALRTNLPNQSAKVVILIGGLVAVGVIAVRSGVGIIGIILSDSLTVGVVGEAAVLIQTATLRGIAAPNSGQLVLAPSVGLAIVGSGPAQRIIANGFAVEIDQPIGVDNSNILPLSLPAVKKKPPGPQWPGWPHP